MTHDEDIASHARFVSNFNTPEKMQANLEKYRAAQEQVNNGAPIPPVSALDLKQLWHASHRIRADNPQASTSIGLAVYAGYGVEAAAEPERLVPVWLRHTLLSDLVDRGLLDSYLHDGEPEEKVFAAAANVPCDKEDLFQATTKQFFSQLSPEEAAQAKVAMRSEGYDPDKPRITDRFLGLLRTND